jgi:hypothetical protein
VKDPTITKSKKVAAGPEYNKEHAHFFFDVKGIVHREFVPPNTTVNSGFYCEPELLITYFGVQTLKLHTRLPIQLNNACKLEEKQKTYANSGVYRLQFMNVHLKTVYRTNRTHIQSPLQIIHSAIRTSRQNSKFAQHIPETGHDYSTRDQTMEILHVEKTQA